METLQIPESIKIYGSYPKVYGFPWTTLTNITEEYIELHCENDYEPTAIIRMNINDDNIEINSQIENKKQWRDDMYKKLNKLNMRHCKCCPNHGWDRSVIISCEEEILYNDTPFSDYYNNFNDPKYEDILSDEKYLFYRRDHDVLYSYYFDQYKLDIWFSRIYIISDGDNNIVNMLHAPEYDLQMGDQETKIRFLDDKMIVIENKGDVWSCLILRI